MDAFLVWALALVLTLGCVLHGRFVARYQDESFAVNFLYVARGLVMGALASTYWLQIFGFAGREEVIHVVRGLGIPAWFIAGVYPVLLRPRGQAMADGIVDTVREKFDR